jgi:AcrR family transcriptional regulator
MAVLYRITIRYAQKTAGRPERRRRLTAAERRAAILEAASRTFADQGYEGASMAMIANAAGVAPSVLYDHFPSKRDLHIDLLRTHAQALIAHAARRVETNSYEELVRVNIEAFFEFVEEHRFAWRMLFREPPADQRIGLVHERLQRDTTAAIAGLFALAPDLRPPVEIDRDALDQLLAEAVKSTNNALAAWWWDHREVPRRDIAALAERLLWHGLHGFGPPSS